MHISAQLIESYPREYGSWSWAEEKLLIPLEAHDKARSSKIFLNFRAKKFNKLFFLSFGPSCWNCTFKLPRSRAFQRRTACPSAAKKSCGSHLFWVGPGEADETTFVQELLKAVTFLPYVLSWWNFMSEPGLSRAFQRRIICGGAPKKSCTSHQCTPYANWSVTKGCFHHLEGCRVLSEVRLENCTQVLGVGQIWRACDSQLR